MSRGQKLAVVSVCLTAVFELITLAIRFSTGTTAVEFNETAPFVLQIHHMFWSVPVFAVAWFVREKAAGVWLTGAGIALVASDLVHHVVVLPLLVGNAGWHWP